MVDKIQIEKALIELYGIKCKIVNTFIKKNKSMLKIDLNLLEQDLTRVETLLNNNK